MASDAQNQWLERVSALARRPAAGLRGSGAHREHLIGRALQLHGGVFRTQDVPEDQAAKSAGCKPSESVELVRRLAFRHRSRPCLARLLASEEEVLLRIIVLRHSVFRRMPNH